MIIKTNQIIPAGLDALTIGCIILIRPDKASDLALIEHEKTHVKQFLDNPIMYTIHCLFKSPQWVLRYEAEAYAVQIQYLLNHENQDLQNNLTYFTDILSKNYGLKFSTQYIRAALESAYRGLK